ncbi:MAG: sensor domain-containing diguanylate cyclase [Halanaerobiales bacterium]|nr:sensor domain-containing diguanylate cyclase [Halanaerobiales bacterium]
MSIHNKFEKEKSYKKLAESVNAILWQYDIEFDSWEYVSPQAERILGYKPNEWLGLDFWVNHVHHEDRDEAKSYCLQCTAKGEDHVFEYRFRKKDGTYAWIRDEVSVVMQDGEPKKIRGFMIDITEIKNLENKIRNLSYKDHLTGLYNRRYLDNEIQRLNYSRNYPISVIVGDLDKLKKVNDKYGHKQGDIYIKKAAEVLKNIFRTEEIIARTGGDEFAIILTETDENNTKKICKRIHKEFIKLNKKKDLPFPINISLGSATVSNKDMNIYKCYERADRNMYINKEAK